MSSSNGDHRLTRAAKNEQAFQRHNRRRAAIAERAGAPEQAPVPFVCECADPACARALSMTVEEYERAVAPDDQFVVIAGHQDPRVERVVETHETYLVVSKPDLRRR
jgi:hypothetical protein